MTPLPLTLAIDTAAGQCAAAIAGPHGLLSGEALAMARGHDAHLADLVGRVLGAAGRRAGAIARVAVVCGPGSFTGVRIGVAFARAFALAVGAPCLGVSTLAAFAGVGLPGLRGAVMPAPDGVFLALYQDAEAIVSPRRITLAQAQALAAAWPQARWSGPAAGLLGADPGLSSIDIAALALAARSLAPAQYPPDPLYLRAPDAAPPQAPP